MLLGDFNVWVGNVTNNWRHNEETSNGIGDMSIKQPINAPNHMFGDHT